MTKYVLYSLALVIPILVYIAYRLSIKGVVDPVRRSRIGYAFLSAGILIIAFVKVIE